MNDVLQIIEQKIERFRYYWGSLPDARKHLVYTIAFVGFIVVLLILWNFASPTSAKFVATVTGGLVALWQIRHSNRRATAAEKSATLMAQGHVIEIFKNAVDHLGHQSASVRLGGIYSLQELAQHNDRYRKRAFEVLAAHIREMASDDGERSSIEIENVLRILFAPQFGKNAYYDSRVDLSRVNLSGLQLRGLDMSNVNLAHANLSRIFIFNSHLKHTRLSEVNLQGARIHNTTLVNADLSFAKLNDAIFKNTDLSKAKFMFANCTNTDLVLAKNLNAEMLMHAQTLHDAVLPEKIEAEIKSKKPKLFESPPIDMSPDGRTYLDK